MTTAVRIKLIGGRWQAIGTDARSLAPAIGFCNRLNTMRAPVAPPAIAPGFATYRCACCGDPFTARTADRKRGWARYCSKSCKAKKQEARTGQYSRYLQGANGGLCFPDRSEDGLQP